MPGPTIPAIGATRQYARSVRRCRIFQHFCHQKVTTFDSAMRFANLMGSMNDAFSDLRSASVTPRATLQAPQTKTGTYSPTADSDRSDRVQVCGTNRVGVRRRRRKVFQHQFHEGVAIVSRKRAVETPLEADR